MNEDKPISKKTIIILSSVVAVLFIIAVVQFLPDSEQGKANAVVKKDNAGDSKPALAGSSTVSTTPKVNPAVSTTLFGNPKTKSTVSIPGTNSPSLDKPVLSSGGRIDCLVEPHKVVDVASATAGVIKTIKVERGDVVKKGAVVAIMENGVELANVKLAAARLKFAKEKNTRVQKLFQQKVVSFQEKDKAATELRVATLELRRARELLQQRTIVSPISGVVVKLYISPGELSDQQKVMKIAQIDPLKIEVVAPIRLLGTMHKGMNAKIWPEGPKKGPFMAKVTIVDRVVDAASGTFGVRLLLPNPSNRIPAGVKCEAAFLDKSGKIAANTR